jgi:hypothetical protein
MFNSAARWLPWGPCRESEMAFWEHRLLSQGDGSLPYNVKGLSSLPRWASKRWTRSPALS